MNVVQVKFAPWDRIYNFDPQGHNYKKGDRVVVKTELGIEIAEVAGFIGLELGGEESGTLKPILRRANAVDIKKMIEKEADQKEAFKFCKKLIKKYNLPMKLFDVRFSFDGGRITFAYIAPERVDFRDLVKELTRRFQKTIRMQQVGVREETRMFCHIGFCGREACCRQFLRNLGNISLEQAYTQQVAHRGSERISGVCGRLLCCLAYEQPVYEEMAKALPLIGSTIKTEKGRGRVVSWHILKQTVNVKLEDKNGTVIEVKM